MELRQYTQFIGIDGVRPYAADQISSTHPDCRLRLEKSLKWPFLFLNPRPSYLGQLCKNLYDEDKTNLYHEDH